MDEATSTPQVEPLTDGQQRRRAGQRALYVWLPDKLFDRVKKQARAEERTLKVYVERTLRSALDLAEQYAATAAPGRQRRRGRG
jgi:inner membrane protein involved in colicin E2 resistance